MNRRWALLKGSDGARGQQGKKKIYEIEVDGAVLTCRWGMAEKRQRQTSVRVFRSEQAALAAAYEKLYAKTSGGYSVAYAV
jgi:predicted DNA-binding WGR domain protein